MTSLPLRWALTPPFHPYHRSGRTRDAGRLFSVTLLYPHGYQVIGLRGALRCPDFPPPDEPAATERTCTAKVGINARKTAVSAEKSAVSPPRRAGMPPDGALPSIRHAACGRLSGVAANRANRAEKQVERMGRSEWVAGPNGWAESNGWRKWSEPAGCGGSRAPSVQKKVTRKAGATRRPGFSVVRDDRVTVSSSRGRCSDGPAAGCGGRAARTRRAG